MDMQIILKLYGIGSFEKLAAMEQKDYYSYPNYTLIISFFQTLSIILGHPYKWY